jgi:uncharacterized membrane protein YcjF (UPF0283 family)
MMRERDDGGGRRIARPMNVSAVDSDYREEAYQQSDQREEAEAELETGAMLKPSPLFNNTFTGLVVLLGGLLAIYLFTQTVVFVGTIATYPDYVRYPALGILGILVLIVFWSVLRLSASYYKLRQNRQIQFEEIRRLNELKLLSEAVGKKRQAKAQLMKYLDLYDPEDSKFANRLIRTGMTREELGSLAGRRETLLTGEFEDTQRWLEEFRDGFQAVQDQTTERIIKKYALRIGVGTAAVPKGLIDSLIVTWGSVTMLNELCAVYNLRLGRIGTFVLLGKVFRNVFIAGVLEDVTDEGTQLLFNSIKDSVPGIGLIRRPAEGLINALLIRRLGYGAQRLLRSIS